MFLPYDVRFLGGAHMGGTRALAGFHDVSAQLPQMADTPLPGKSNKGTKGLSIFCPASFTAATRLGWPLCLSVRPSPHLTPKRRRARPTPCPR